MTVYIFPRYHVEGDSWPIILAYLNGLPIYRRNHVRQTP